MHMYNMLKCIKYYENINLKFATFAFSRPLTLCPSISHPSNSCVDILMVRHFHVRHFQRPPTGLALFRLFVRLIARKLYSLRYRN